MLGEPISAFPISGLAEISSSGGQYVIYQKHCDFLLSTEGAGALLKMAAAQVCAGIDCPGEEIFPPAKDLYLALFVNQPTIDCALARGDIDLATFVTSTPIQLNPGATVEACLDHMQGPAPGIDGVWRWIMDQHEFVFVSGPESVYGAALILTDAGDPPSGGELLGVCLFNDGPYAMSVAGDVIKLTGSLALECNIPALPDD